MRAASRQATAVLVGAVLSAAGGQALAQAIERNLPPAPKPGPSVIVTPDVTPADTDATPLGPTLTALVVLGPTDRVRADVTLGLHLEASARLQAPKVRRGLQRFLGRPLSRKLIGEVQAAIVLDYRAAGLPLVSVSTPEQEVSTGVLQLRVVEFHLARKTAPGAQAPAYVLSRLRAQPGQPVDTEALSQDVDWLNRDPFRKSQVVFQAGDQLGDTNLILQTQESRPFSVYAGYEDSGSPLTGFDRYFAGTTVAVPLLHDAYLSYQFTTSNDGIFSQDRPFNGAAEPRYLSHSGRLVIPTVPRQDVEASLNYVDTNELTIYEGTPFTAHSRTEEATLGYRSALSNLWGVLPGEAVVGVEFKREDGGTLFSNEVAEAGSVDVFQTYLEYAAQEHDALGGVSVDLTAHVSPGGVDLHNTDANFTASSHHRSTSAEYAYMSGSVIRTTALPVGFNYVLTVVGQYAPNPLPLTEQIGTGGASLVRGYTLDDGVFDSAVVARNELHTPSFPLTYQKGAYVDALAPYLFVDAAYAKNAATRADASPVGAGFGADYQLGRHLTASLNTAWALKTEGLTHAGQFRLYSRVALAF